MISLLIASCVALDTRARSELNELLHMLEGSYRGAAPNPRAPDGATQIIVHKFVPIHAPRFGNRVFYYQLSQDAADGSPLQQKIFVFEAQQARDSMRMRAYVFAPGQIPGNLEQDLDRIERLSPNELMSFPQACAFEWRPVDGGFQARVSAGNCGFISERFGQEIRPDMSYRITGDRFYWQEKLYGPEGTVLASTPGTLVAHRE